MFSIFARTINTSESGKLPVESVEDLHHEFRFLIAVLVVLLSASVAFGQFLNMPQYDNGTYPGAFRQADVNNDGRPDIIGIRSPQTNGFEITFLPGTGTGGFGAAVNTTITGIDSVTQQQFLVRDFNGDGKLDVVVFGNDHITGQGALGVMFGNGDGTFQAPKITITGTIAFPSTETYTVNAGDYNNDGKADIAYVSGSTLRVIFGKGDGTFTSPLTTTLNTAVLGIASADFNNDKKLDILASSSKGTFFYAGNGNGTFQAPITVGTLELTALVPAELNGDGNLDFIAGGPGRGFSVFLGDGTGHFPTKHSYTTVPTVSSIAVADFNGDGHLDVALLSTIGHPPYITIYLNSGSGTFTLGKTYNADGTGGGTMMAADLNGDKKIDLAFTNGSGGVTVMDGNGNGTFKGNYAIQVLSGNSLTLGNFNADTKPDLFLPQASQTLLGNGDGTFSLVSAHCLLFSATAGDFNKDGKEDVSGIYSVNSVNEINVCLGNGKGTFAADGQADQGIQHNLVLTGDFNNDGKLDLAASDQNGVSILLGNGNGTFQSGIPTAVSASFPNFALGDFNRDGKLDFATVTSSGLEVYLGKGDGTFQNPIVTSTRQGGFITVADLNKDGIPDVIISNCCVLSVMIGKGNGSFNPPVNYGLATTTAAVVADFNGDGNPDVAVGVGGGLVDVFLGNGQGKLLAPPTVFRVGGPRGPVVVDLVTADFNGDKKPDLAVEIGGAVITLLHQ